MGLNHCCSADYPNFARIILPLWIYTWTREVFPSWRTEELGRTRQKCPVEAPNQALGETSCSLLPPIDGELDRYQDGCQPFLDKAVAPAADGRRVKPALVSSHRLRTVGQLPAKGPLSLALAGPLPQTHTVTCAGSSATWRNICDQQNPTSNGAAYDPPLGLWRL